MKKIILFLVVLGVLLTACRTDPNMVGKDKGDLYNAPAIAAPIFHCSELPNSSFCPDNSLAVCGDDGKTYGNNCQACANTGVISYTKGECTPKLS